jgi:hypothetical protein
VIIMVRFFGMVGLMSALLLAFCLADANGQEQKKKKGGKKGFDPAAQFAKIDKDGNKKISKAEYKESVEGLAKKLQETLGDKFDKEKADKLIADSLTAFDAACKKAEVSTSEGLNQEQYAEMQKERFKGKKGKAKDA